MLLLLVYCRFFCLLRKDKRLVHATLVVKNSHWLRPGFVKISYKLHVITRLEAEDRIGTKNNESSDIDGQHKNLSEKVKGKYSSGNQVSTHMM